MAAVMSVCQMPVLVRMHRTAPTVSTFLTFPFCAQRAVKSGSATEVSSVSHTPHQAPATSSRMALGLYYDDPKVDPKALRRRLQVLKEAEGGSGASAGAAAAGGQGGRSPGPGRDEEETDADTLVEEPVGRWHTSPVLKSLPLLGASGQGGGRGEGGVVTDSEAESEVPASSVASQRAWDYDSVTESLPGHRGGPSSQAWVSITLKLGCCTVLHCTVLSCTYCTALFCAVPY